MRREAELGQQLADAVDQDIRAALVADPWSSLPDHYGLTVEVLDTSPRTGCDLDGTYDKLLQRVQVMVRSSRRRMHFTLLHELGHHLLRSDRDCLRHFAQLKKAGRNIGPSEEQIADAFAAEILIPRAEATPILGSGTMRARQLAALFDEFCASRSACAVRAAEQCPGDGYVVIARGSEIVYAAPFGEQVTYRVKRGTIQPDSSPISIAAERSTWQGTGRLTFPSGRTTPFDWSIDAVTSDGFTFGVFTNERFPGEDWAPPAEHIARHDAPQVVCEDCDLMTDSWERCQRCPGYVCAECGRCPRCRTKKAAVKTRYCPGCFLTLPLASFDDGSELCRDGLH